MPVLVVQGQVIDLGNSGSDPNWAPALIAFCTAVAAALQGVAGDFDVSPQIFTLDAYNPGVNVAIPLLNFPVSNVLSVQISYSVVRTTTTTNVTDAGVLTMVYNATNPVNAKWELNRTGNTDGGAGITFSVTDAGIVQFTTTTLGGLSHQGKLCYSGKALQFV